MKKIIVSLIVLSLVAVGNINTAQSQEKIYKNIYYDTDARSTVISLYSGKTYKNLVPLKQYIIYYSEDNLPREKVIYNWDRKNNEWKESRKYDYEYTSEGDAIGNTDAKWMNEDQAWSDETEYSLDLLEIDTQLLTVKE